MHGISGELERDKKWMNARGWLGLAGGPHTGRVEGGRHGGWERWRFWLG